MHPFRLPSLPPVNGHGLVMPPAGSRALALAYMRYLNATLAAFVEQGPSLPEAIRPAHARTVELVQRAFAKNQKAALGCFAATTVGTPLHCGSLREALPVFQARIDRAAREVTPHVLLELAARRLLDEGEVVEVPLAALPGDDLGPLQLDSLALGLGIRPPAAATALRFASGELAAIDSNGAEIARLALAPDAQGSDGDFSVERVYHAVGHVTRLALVDHNPIAEFEAHPDKAGNHITLGDRPAAEWIASLDEAFGLVGKFCPDVFAEMQMMLHEVVPVGYHAERHLSASYREAIGTIYVTLHHNVMTMAEALIHEFQHNKANVACYSADFLHNAYDPLYKSPVRPDPRPLWGILLAVHAFLPVALLYRRMRAAGHPLSTRPDFERRLAEIDLKNHEGMEMLRAHAQWTPAGKAMWGELDAIDRAHLAERAARGLATAPTEAHVS